MVLTAASIAAPASAAAAQPAPGERFGLFSAERFVALEGEAAHGLAPAAGVWHFRDEWIAVPEPGEPAAGTDGPPPPPLIWLAAPELIEPARLDLPARELRLPGGQRAPLEVVPPLPENDLHVDDTTFEFFAERPLRIRSFPAEPAGGAVVAHTIWPLDADVPWRELEVEPLVETGGLGDLVRAQVAEQPRARLLWERPREGARDWTDRPVLAIVLSGAQADTPGSHAGHIAVTTGRLGAEGGWASWLANNVYPIETLGDKGIVPGPVPMDNYLTDLNSGQAMYRPVYVLVAVLDDPGPAREVQAAFDDFFPRYWCREIEFHRARHNSTEMSVDVLRGVGWEIPRVGGTSWLKGAIAAGLTAVITFELRLARDAWSYFTEERTDLFPRVAFETAAGDLLALVGETPPRPHTAFEESLRAATDAVLFLRFPQIPSKRPTGSYPVASIREYRTRVGIAEAFGADPEPETPRPLPEHLEAACAAASPDEPDRRPGYTLPRSWAESTSLK